MTLYLTEDFAIEFPDVFDDTALVEAVASKSKAFILDVAAVHEGLTRNFNYYPAKVLEAALQSWTHPYPKPILRNHDVKNSPVLGRVMGAKMDKNDSGTPFVRLQVGLTDPGAITEARDKRILTGSIGATASSANCSICNVELAESNCRHQWGKVYNGKVAYRHVNEMSFHEYSFVNVPGDSQSMVLGVASELNEDDDQWVRPARIFAMDMDSQQVVEFVEGHDPINILESMTKKNAHQTYNNLKGTWISLSAMDYVDDELTNKNSENVTHSSSDHTIATEESSVGDTKSVLEKNTIEENEMPEDSEVTETETDLLDVVEQLSDDLASNTDDITEATGDDDTVTNDNDTEMTEDTTAAADESGNEPDGSEAQPVEEGSDTIDETEAPEEGLAENANADEPADTEATETTVQEEQTEDVEVLVNENARLSEENKKLRGIVHKMLAERVVDKKIDLGLVESTERASALEEHIGRSAASLADSLKDMAKMPSVKVATLSTTEGFELEEKVLAAGKDEKNSPVVEEGAPVKKELTRKQKEALVTNAFAKKMSVPVFNK